MNRLENLSRSAFSVHIKKIIELLKDYFPKWFNRIVNISLSRLDNTISIYSLLYMNG